MITVINDNLLLIDEMKVKYWEIELKYRNKPFN
jgi:hypothetical protein